jgi:nucleoside-diphosphate-sugar epimerase
MSYKYSKILVTGGAGFIGSMHACEAIDLVLQKGKLGEL